MYTGGGEGFRIVGLLRWNSGVESFQGFILGSF